MGGPGVPRHLVVANQTLGGVELERAIARRTRGGDGRFFVLVPMIEPQLEATSWEPDDPLFGVPAQSGTAVDAIELAHRRSRHRLGAIIGKIAGLGGRAEGEVGQVDPFAAVQDVLEREAFDEIIISTLPAGVSRWVRMDLPSRVERLVDCPVVTVEAESSDEQRPPGATPGP